MKKFISFGILALTIIGILFISGCVQQEITCNKPYIKVGTECCLDVNDNNICDKDETPTTTTTSEPYCGDGICNVNEKAPECEDCKASIRLENVECKIIKVQPPYVVDDLEITYDITNLGDPVYVYPAVDLYAGWSESQCSNKDYLPFYKEWDCPGGCYFLIKDDVSNKKYEDIAYGINQPDQGTGEIGDNPVCFYYKFYLMPYNPNNPPSYGNERPYEPLATWESNLNPCS